MTTIPHSGTRFTRDAFENAGVTVDTWVKQRKAPKTSNKILYWTHFGNELFMQYEEGLRKDWPKKFVVVRNPLSVFATHFSNINSVENEQRRFHKSKQVIVNLTELYCQQRDYINEYEPYVHPVERGLDTLSEWAGIDLYTTGFRHPGAGTPLKAAVANQDLDKIIEELHGTACWHWFTGPLFDIIGEYYINDLGYDFWWL